MIHRACEIANGLIYHFTQFVQFPPMEEYAPELFAYLVQTYEMDRVISAPNWPTTQLSPKHKGIKASPAATPQKIVVRMGFAVGFMAQHLL